jgi:SNF2 family DNA or RNA helicase
MSKTSSGCTGIVTNSQIGGRFALKRGGRVLIADEMGLGKTLQVA